MCRDEPAEAARAPDRRLPQPRPEAARPPPRPPQPPAGSLRGGREHCTDDRGNIHILTFFCVTFYRFVF